MNCRDDVIIDRPEGCDQTGNTIRLAGAFISPGAFWMKSQNCFCEIVGDIDLSRGKIILCLRPYRMTGFFTNGLSLSDPDKIVFASSPVLGLSIDNTKIPFVDILRPYCSLFLPTVAWLPLRQAKARPHMVPAGLPIIIGKRMRQEAVRGAWIKANGERAICP